MFLRLRDFRVKWVNLASLGYLGGDHGLIRLCPTLHETQRFYSCFRDHPIVFSCVGFFRLGVHPMENGAFIIFGTSVCC
ncbi:hypothetical protein D3C81_905570 [compost metagenome]